MSALIEWPRDRLGSLVQAKYGKSLPHAKRHGGDVPVYGSNGVVGWHDRALTKGRTIVIGRKGSSGEVNFSETPCWPIDTTYYIDEPGPFRIEFLDYLLRSLRLTALDRSTAIPGLNRDQLYDIDVPVPPDAEQAALVVRLNAAEGHRSKAMEHLSKSRRVIERFRQAVLAAACSGRLTAGVRNIEDDPQVGLPGGWARRSVAELCTEIVDCPHSTPRWTETGGICIRTTNFRRGRLDLSDVRYVAASTFAERNRRLAPRERDVLLSREGGILGVACMVPANARICLGQRMMLMRTNPELCDAAFLMHALNGPAVQRVIAELTGGTASPHLNVGDVKRFQIDLPPIAEQRMIVAQLERLFESADRLERGIASASIRIGRSSQAVLSKAFRGDLIAALPD